MELFIKNIEDKENPRNDNSDKLKLFPNSPSFLIAREQRKDWDFIKNDGVARNISYQLQYIDFSIRLYNEYQIYLTLESLLFKNVLISINSIVEAALYEAIKQIRERSELEDEWRKDLTALLGQAYHEYKLIDKDLWHFFHDLRKERNNLHLHALTEREYERYNFTQANEALVKLEELRKSLDSVTKQNL